MRQLVWALSVSDRRRKKRGGDGERKKGAPQQRYGAAWLCGILKDGGSVEKNLQLPRSIRIICN